MDHSHKLLLSVADAANMGMDSVEMLLKKTEDEKMIRELNHLSAQYKQSKNQVEKRLSETGGEITARNPMAKMGAWMGVQMDTLTDRSNSHLADMLIQGTTMGIVDITKARAQYPDADDASKRIADEFLKNENQSIETLKTYL